MPPDPHRPWRWWFRAAAVYNLAWGVAAAAFPVPMLRIAGMSDQALVPFFQCIGMMVGVYAIGYWLLAVDPLRFAPFVWIGLAGKILGPVGFCFAAMQGQLPWSFGWFNVFNDVIWLPAFILFAARHAMPFRSRDTE